MSTRITKMPSTELNNNSPELFDGPFKRTRNQSAVSVSSASSCHSDSSEDADGASRRTSAPEPLPKPDKEKSDFRRCRSMSDGAAYRLPNQDPYEVFPSLPDSVLVKMGLLGGGPRERLNDEELEQKFVALALAFTIDAATIKDRCERQRRYRDQTETNLSVEIERLIQKANRIQPLCVDAETTELLSALLAQIDVVVRASSHATICSERYGAVQHEDRISEAVNVMINHVNLLKQQRDSTRRQLQYTKRVLQNTNSEAPPATKQVPTIPNGRVITRRRASIATITQPFEVSKFSDNRKITRRISDLSLRATSVSRNSRPSRLELGVGDLVKIKEGMVENEHSIPEPAPNQNENESNHDEEISSPEESPPVDEDLSRLSLRYRLLRRFRKFRKDVEEKYEKWTEDGTIHEICCFCALLCFSISIITMANIIIEVEFAKRGLNQSKFFWYWTSGGHNVAPLTKKICQGGTHPT